VSMDDMHAGALEISVTADNWSGEIEFRSGIDGRVVNAGARLYEKFNNKHLEHLAEEIIDEDGVQLFVRTCQSHVYVAQAARTRLFHDGALINPTRKKLREPGYIAQQFKVRVAPGQTISLEKL